MKTKRIVVKIGTHVLTKDTKTLDRSVIQSIADVVGILNKKDIDVVVVSSGAVAAGSEILKSAKIKASREAKAAVGQIKLMQAYEHAFAKYKKNVGQVLLTRSDFRNRTSYENAYKTLIKLLEQSIIPIINENDVTTTHELSFGDNDSLATYTAISLEATHLFFMTNQDGLFDDDPNTNTEAKLIPEVENAESLYQSLPKRESSTLGLGGIISKVKSARLAASAGIETWITNGFDTENICKILGGKHIGTRFVPQKSLLSPRERWMLCANSVNARLSIDHGAAEALRDRKSLLAVGVKKVSGTFSARDIVEIVQTDGVVVGFGVINYSADEIRYALTSEKKLNREVIHTNNLRLI